MHCKEILEAVSDETRPPLCERERERERPKEQPRLLILHVFHDDGVVLSQLLRRSFTSRNLKSTLPGKCRRRRRPRRGRTRPCSSAPSNWSTGTSRTRTRRPRNRGRANSGPESRGAARFRETSFQISTSRGVSFTPAYMFIPIPRAPQLINSLFLHMCHGFS